MSLTAGILYLLTFVSIPTLALYRAVKGAVHVPGSGSDNAAIIGGILEITVALAGIGTAVVLVPDPQEQDPQEQKEAAARASECTSVPSHARNRWLTNKARATVSWR